MYVKLLIETLILKMRMMKANFIALSLVIVMGGCTIQPVSINRIEGTQSYVMDCNSGINKCYQKADELCPSGYDIIEHSIKTSTVMPHYGEYPMMTNTESLTLDCK